MPKRLEYVKMNEFMNQKIVIVFGKVETNQKKKMEMCMNLIKLQEIVVKTIYHMKSNNKESNNCDDKKAIEPTFNGHVLCINVFLININDRNNISLKSVYNNNNRQRSSHQSP